MYSVSCSCQYYSVNKINAVIDGACGRSADGSSVPGDLVNPKTFFTPVDTERTLHHTRLDVCGLPVIRRYVEFKRSLVLRWF